MSEMQCDQIWQNFATLAKSLKGFVFVKKFNSIKPIVYDTSGQSYKAHYNHNLRL